MNDKVGIYTKEDNGDIRHEIIRDGTCFNYFNYALLFMGRIEEFRISKSVARWKKNFTVPTEPYDKEEG
jgi:hypothetical protein